MRDLTYIQNQLAKASDRALALADYREGETLAEILYVLSDQLADWEARLRVLGGDDLQVE